MAITIYTLPDCVQCETTKNFLTKKDIEFSTVDLSRNTDEFRRLVEMGHDKVPVVITDDDHWQGFRPDKLFKLIKQ